MKSENRKHPLNKIEYGFILGFLFPAIIFISVYFRTTHSLSLINYLKNMWQMHALTKLMSLCVFSNLLIFYGLLKLKFEVAAKGVLGATIIYALLFLISKAL